MDRIWQWAWDRHGSRYSWALCAITGVVAFPIYLLLSIPIVAAERADRYPEAVAATVLAAVVLAYAFLPAGSRRLRAAERWAAGHDVDRAKALADTYRYARGAAGRGVVGGAVSGSALMVVVGAITGATTPRLIQYGITGASLGISVSLIAAHTYVEAAMRPARVALTGDTGGGDALPRSRPSFTAWASLSVLAAAFSFAAAGAWLAGVVNLSAGTPALAVVFGFALTLGMAAPITISTGIAPSLRPIRDLAEGTARVAAGDYSQRLPVVQDDDLGALAASFNRMQAGLAERRRLHAAFGTYVDPALAAKLLEQGDDVFTGERRAVTVMFIDIRDFTPYAEAHTAEDTVARLNALFEIVVPAVVQAGGHVNKFLGDGALAVFGAPNDLPDHADAALNAALRTHRLVEEQFGGELRIGIGINTGVVIAGTIGGGGKLEFTLIGDSVNVASRVEQLTKTTGDTILLTQQCIDALGSRPAGLVDRGLHVLKGKSAAVQVFGLGATVYRVLAAADDDA